MSDKLFHFLSQKYSGGRVWQTKLFFLYPPEKTDQKYPSEASIHSQLRFHAAEPNSRRCKDLILNFTKQREKRKVESFLSDSKRLLLVKAIKTYWRRTKVVDRWKNEQNLNEPKREDQYYVHRHYGRKKQKQRKAAFSTFPWSSLNKVALTTKKWQLWLINLYCRGRENDFKPENPQFEVKIKREAKSTSASRE